MLIHSLQKRLDDPSARSFQLVGEDLALLSGAAIREAAAGYEADLARAVPTDLRAAFEREQTAVLAEGHAFVRRYSRSLNARIRGYLALGRRMRFELPWPVVAVLGLCQVIDGIGRSRVYGLVGAPARRIGIAALDELASSLDDILLRTNRGIFADSIPTVLYALRCHALRGEGKTDLAEALLSGPLPPIFDEESRALCKGLVAALEEEDGEARFHRLSALTLTQFAREQAIFSYHLGKSFERRPGLLGRLGRMREVLAPVVEQKKGVREVVFRSYRLPEGFEIKDHAARVDHFGKAYVVAVTRDVRDYQAAIDYVLGRFGKQGERASVVYGRGAARM
ncbi:MAG: hypothetical protein QM820_61870 [Minicystis sp.]